MVRAPRREPPPPIFKSACMPSRIGKSFISNILNQTTQVHIISKNSNFPLSKKILSGPEKLHRTEKSTLPGHGVTSGWTKPKPKKKRAFRTSRALRLPKEANAAVRRGEIVFLYMYYLIAAAATTDSDLSFSFEFLLDLHILARRFPAPVAS